MRDAGVAVLVLATVVAWGTFSRRLERADLTGPIVFVVAGLALDAIGVLRLRAVSSRIRRALNVEGGFNDGLAAPVVLAALAGASVATDVTGTAAAGSAMRMLALGLLAGLAIGGVGGTMVRLGRRRGWIDDEFGGPTILALALLAYAAAVFVDGSGFVAAFAGGLAFRNTAGRRAEREATYAEQSGAALTLVVWLLFGSVIAPITIASFDWRVAAYAVLSLAAVRMVAVALALIGVGFHPATVALIGWFGPRGITSVIFALLAVEELGPRADAAGAVIGLTVLFSVFAHGISAVPLAKRYGASAAAHRPAESAVKSELPVRRASGDRE